MHPPLRNSLLFVEIIRRLHEAVKLKHFFALFCVIMRTTFIEDKFFVKSFVITEANESPQFNSVYY